MAKRKRLTPAQPSYLDAVPEVKSAPLGASAAPIAQVAGEASTVAALEEVTQVLQSARKEGRMIELLPLEAIDERHLVRDRLEQNEEEMASLVDSLRARGQQMPIEVVVLPDAKKGGALTYGLISGWRRLTALRMLYQETSDSKFAYVKAIVITPDTAQDAYVAMVEENEIRVNLSHYERARIAVRAIKEGVYSTQRSALQGLFGNATRSKRSKIGSFITLVEAFDTSLYFPSAISEKLGLALVREMTHDPGFVKALKTKLNDNPRDSAEAEIQLLLSGLAERQAPSISPKPPSYSRMRQARSTSERSEQIITHTENGIEMRFTPDQGHLELVGDAISDRFVEALKDWLRSH